MSTSIPENVSAKLSLSSEQSSIFDISSFFFAKKKVDSPQEMTQIFNARLLWAAQLRAHRGFWKCESFAFGVFLVCIFGGIWIPQIINKVIIPLILSYLVILVTYHGQLTTAPNGNYWSYHPSARLEHTFCWSTFFYRRSPSPFRFRTLWANGHYTMDSPSWGCSEVRSANLRRKKGIF